MLDEAPPPLVLAGMEMLPVPLHAEILLQLGIRFGREDSILDEGRGELRDEKGVGAAPLQVGADRADEEIHVLGTAQRAEQMENAEREEPPLRLLERARQRWHPDHEPGGLITLVEEDLDVVRNHVRKVLLGVEIDLPLRQRYKSIKVAVGAVDHVENRVGVGKEVPRMFRVQDAKASAPQDAARDLFGALRNRLGWADFVFHPVDVLLVTVRLG